MDNMPSLDFKKPYVWISTWFGCGFMRPAPGTWGTLGAMPFGILLSVFGGWMALAVGIIIVTALGFYAVDKFQKETGTHDSGMIVIDEVAGLWITLLACSLSPLSIVLAFVLFRFFDILKPWPVGWLDKKLDGAAGVMLDDLMAGVYAALCLWGLHYVGIG